MGSNDVVQLTEREWNALVETLKDHANDIRRLSDESVRFNAKVAVLCAIGGSVSGLIFSVVGHVLTKMLP